LWLLTNKQMDVRYWDLMRYLDHHKVISGRYVRAWRSFKFWRRAESGILHDAQECGLAHAKTITTSQVPIPCVSSGMGVGRLWGCGTVFEWTRPKPSYFVIYFEGPSVANVPDTKRENLKWALRTTIWPDWLALTKTITTIVDQPTKSGNASWWMKMWIGCCQNQRSHFVLLSLSEEIYDNKPRAFTQNYLHSIWLQKTPRTFMLAHLCWKIQQQQNYWRVRWISLQLKHSTPEPSPFTSNVLIDGFNSYIHSYFDSHASSVLAGYLEDLQRFSLEGRTSW
jgi:hypothetical protein